MFVIILVPIIINTKYGNILIVILKNIFKLSVNYQLLVQFTKEESKDNIKIIN